MILVTGGAGFIGSRFIEDWFRTSIEPVVSLDLLTDQANPAHVEMMKLRPNDSFVHGNIGDLALVRSLLDRHRPRAVVHFAAETHVDRSLKTPLPFLQTNAMGTATLVEAAFSYWRRLDPDARRQFRFLHVSTDEVYGDLAEGAPPFSEQSPYRPSNPYSASKAAADHWLRAFHRSMDFPILITNCTNNFGPRQHSEKFIPRIIVCALNRKPIPVYGDGTNVRDWLFVADHVEALRLVLERGVPGETYNIAGRSERRNIDVVHEVCTELDRVLGNRELPSSGLISFVQDRPGHDRRYALDDRKIRGELGWAPKVDFTSGIRETIQWFVDRGRDDGISR